MHGAVIVRKENGQVRGCGGGILKFAVMNLEPDSRMLILPTGRNVLHADCVGYKNNNMELARQAIYMFEVADDMERKRVGAFQLMRTTSNAEMEELPVPSKK